MMMLATTNESINTLRLPVGADDTWMLHLTIHIRDVFNGITKFEIPSIVVTPDWTEWNQFVESIQQPTNRSHITSIAQLLNSTDTKTVQRTLISLAGILNFQNQKLIQHAATSASFLD